MNRLLLLFLMFLVMPVNAQIRIVDGTDGCPVQAASVFVDGGKCVGVSGTDGTLPLPKGYKGTVTVQHINYTSHEFRTDTVSNNTVRLTPYTYAIPEVTAKYERPDYLVITAYERSYMITDSVPSSFSDAVFDYYIPLRHGRIRRKALSTRNLHKIRQKENGQSEYYTSPTMIKLKKRSLLDKFRDKGYLDDSIANGIMKRSRNGSIQAIKSDTVAKTLTVYTDSAFGGSEGKSYNFFGMKFHFYSYKKSETYDTRHGTPTLRNLVSMYEYLDMSLNLPGKKFKEVRGQTFEGLYVTGIRHCTKKEMKAAMKAEAQRTVTVPQGIPPLSAPLAEAVSRMK